MSEPARASEPVVWVINVAGYDYTEARTFGDLRSVVDSYVPRDKPEKLLKVVTDWVEETSPHDWILPSGLMALNLFAVLAFYQKHGKVRVLVWDPKEGYSPIEVTPSQLDTLSDLLEA